MNGSISALIWHLQIDGLWYCWTDSGFRLDELRFSLKGLQFCLRGELCRGRDAMAKPSSYKNLSKMKFLDFTVSSVRFQNWMVSQYSTLT